MNKKDYIILQNDCAKMLGESLEEYNKKSTKIKINTKFKDTHKDNELLLKLGLTKKDLKRKQKNGK